MRPHDVVSKLQLYFQEFVFALKAPETRAESLLLLKKTALFHWKNWAKAPLAATNDYFAISLNLDGYKTRVGVRMGAGDMSIFQECLACRAYSIDAVTLDPKDVRTILDTGANVGYAALSFAARYPQARIICVEPNPDHCAQLKINTASEPRIVPVQACVTGVPMPEVFIATSGPAWGFKMNASGRGEKVSGLAVDDLMREYRMTHIDLLKIDVEGAEREIFAAGNFLEHVGVVCAEIHGTYDLAAFNHDLARWGFRGRVMPPGRDPKLILGCR